MKSLKPSLLNSLLPVCAAIAALIIFASSASAQLVAYDDAGNYLVNANWTNGANQGFGFTPWTIVTNGPNAHGNYIGTANNPTFVIASVTNVLGTNYIDVFGLYANGTTDINETTAYRGFTNSLGTNTFKLQWGAIGAGSTATTNSGTVHGWCGFTLRNGNATNTSSDFQTGARFYLYFQDGASPSTLYVWDGSNGGFPTSVPGTSFSNLGRNNITNAVEAELTVAADGDHYHLVLKDCVQNVTLYTLDSILMGSSGSSINSAALFCHETTGDQVYNRMQIAVPNIPPTIVNVQPVNGSIYIDSGTNLSFEVDSFNSTVVSNAVNIYLNGVLLNGSIFSTASPTSQLLVTNNTPLAPDTFYNFTVIAQDANGNVVSNNFTFNTFLTSDLYIDAYDYNYTNGLFINSLTPSNSYANFTGSNGIDYFISDLTGANNTAGYRPGDLPQILSLNTDATGDPVDHANLRANGFTAYNIGFTATGNWENYTRAVPVATNYSIYARAASSAGGQFEIEGLANSTATTTNQPLAALGRVNVPITGGSKVFSGQLTPLTDFFGNTVVIPLSGTKTIRCTAISNQGYNIEYLVVVAVTNAAGTLRPYIATGSPSPNATGISLSSPISFTLVNRQTTAPTNTIQMFLNSTNVSSRLVLSSNAVGTTVSWSPTNNLPSNFTNTVKVIFTDSAGVNVTDSWNFITGTTGGALGSGTWSAGGGTNDMFWADGINWTGGTPGPGFNATFAGLGATTNFVTNNIVSTNVTILGLYYNTNNSGYHTTWIQDGVTLTVTNPSTAIGAIVQVGGTTGGDNTFNQKVTNTITGNNGTLLVLGNSQSSGQANQLNFQVRQCAVGVGVAIPNLTTLDMSGLGTLIATVGKFYVAQGGSGGAQSNVSGCVYLARTNIITCLRGNAGQFEVGDSSGGTNTLPGSALYLGITNALYVDTMRIGKNSATNNLMCFNPVFTNNATPAAFIRGTNGLTSRVTTWTIGDADSEPRIANHVQAVVDFSGGKLDALVSNLILGRGETTANDTGYAQGTLTLTAGTLDVINLTNGVQRANNTASEVGIVNVNGTATLVSTNIILAQSASGANASLVSGTLNVTNGTVRGNILSAGGVSTVNVNSGTLIISNSVGTSAAPLTALNLAGASLHLTLNTNTAASVTNIVATSLTIGSGGASQIVIDSINGAGTYTLINYGGTDPGLAHLNLASVPAGYTSSGLVDNGAGTISLSLAVSTGPGTFTNHTGIIGFSLNGANVVITGTNGQSGDAYYLLSSTNVAQPLGQWKTVATNVAGNNGNNTFTFTNVVTPGGQQQFYILSNTNSNH